ncbi:carbonic anhydrase [Saccharopolyspora erythraea]|uniref:beta-class carbonic anhydrase n=1 Tax=Saccharopolyspora erythraea TaxID=1836 RepID=UPI001BA91D2E|nr:carbonic anhydrase [Saccharopolyspora erythraea]QUG99782.1 carbonic anhydrase [Saccharopolyspora erythraea]
MTACDEIVQRNELHVRDASDPGLPAQPSLRVAVVTCMDCRIDLGASLGLHAGEAHVIRNAGGAVTDDVIRSLAISQRKLGTREVMLVHHTGCGLATFTEGEFKDELEAETGQRPSWSVETFADAEQDVRQCMARVRRSPFLGLTTSLRGFVADIGTGALTEVSETAADASAPAGARG